MSYFGWSPYDVVYQVRDFVLHIWNIGLQDHRPLHGLFPAGRRRGRAGLRRPAAFELSALSFGYARVTGCSLS